MNKSENIATLVKALAKAQGTMKNAVKDSDNPYFKSKYADLASVSDACRAELAANDLAVVQLPTMRDGKMVLEYVLLHSSGEYIGSEIEMTPVKADPQGIGSAITYARRYTLAAITGVATEDDDGNAASEHVQKKESVTFAKGNGHDKPAAPNVGQGGVKGETKPPEAAEYITEGQQANFGKAFREALRPELQDKAEVLRHDWLAFKGFKDDNGNPTAKRIPAGGWLKIRDEAIAHAKAL